MLTPHAGAARAPPAKVSLATHDACTAKYPGLPLRTVLAFILDAGRGPWRTPPRCISL